MISFRRFRHLLAALFAPENDKPPANTSRLLKGEITNKASENLRLSIQAISTNAGAALFLFGIALIGVIFLYNATENWLIIGFLLFAIIIFYDIYTRGRIEMKREENRAILLRLAEAHHAPQLDLPLPPGGPPRPPRKRRARQEPGGGRLPGI